ncbi:MAG: Flp family type IVb pilin [Inquilinus sp.]|nr:Flp family type IVb pilin [Inquilinus sp.]
MLTKFRSFLKDESGATAIEYGLIAALVSVAAIVALSALGNSLEAIFNIVAVKLTGACTAAGGTGC